MINGACTKSRGSRSWGRQYTSLRHYHDFAKVTPDLGC
jgi:hypothetical protein